MTIDVKNKRGWAAKALPAFRKRPDRIFLFAFLVPALVFWSALIVSYSDILNEYPKVKDVFSLIFPSLITGSIIFFSAFLATAFAVEAMNTSRETARLQETLKMIREAELDEEFIGSKNAWTKYRSMPERDKLFASLMSVFVLGPDDEGWSEPQKTDKMDHPDASRKISREDTPYETDAAEIRRDNVRKDAQLILVYFNYFELAALSIHQGILDNDFFKEWYGTNFIRVWNNSISAIGALRTLHSNERLYIQWERRALEWGSALNIKARDPIPYGIVDLIKITRESMVDLVKVAKQKT